MLMVITDDEHSLCMRWIPDVVRTEQLFDRRRWLYSVIGPSRAAVQAALCSNSAPQATDTQALQRAVARQLMR